MNERPDVLNNHAIRLAANGNFDDAIACLERAVILDKDNYLLWFNMGITYRDAGNMAGAQKALETAFRLNPENMEVVETLAHVCMVQKKLNDASRVCEFGLDQNELNPKMWNMMGVINFQKGDYLEASDCFERAISLNAFDQDALYNLRDTYLELGNKDAAAECSRRLNELGLK